MKTDKIVDSKVTIMTDLGGKKSKALLLKNETEIEAFKEQLRIANVTNRYFFYYEGEEDGWTFEVEAKDFEEAFDKAYAQWGPQVENMYYRQL